MGHNLGHLALPSRNKGPAYDKSSQDVTGKADESYNAILDTFEEISKAGEHD